MSLLSIGNLTKSYGGSSVLNGVSGTLEQGERVAIVGVNGAGKSTILRIVMGKETADSGQVSIARGRKIGFLEQETQFDPQQKLVDALRSVFASLDEIAEQMRTIEKEIEEASADLQEALLVRYSHLSEKFEAAGGYSADIRLQRVMAGLGFTPEDGEMLCGSLSGGQRTRAALAKLLISEPDILLLDEPTNHLDINAAAWLEEELINWEGSVICVSHDRYFLDRVAQKIWELNWGKLEEYRGNFSHYQIQREERYERRRVEYEAQQAEIAKTEEYIRRFGAGVRSSQARGRERILNRLERLDKPTEHKHLAQKMSAVSRSGDKVIETEGMLIGYPGKPLLSLPKALIKRGDRIAILGPNGCGKTTLLKTLMSEIDPLEGSVRLGASVVPGYYAQGHEKLNWDRTVLDEITQPGMSLEQARGFAAKYLFSGDDVYKKIADLSGGERSRVALARLAQDQSNFLILDEPTNHLDIPSQESLTDMLEQFDGTLMFVSHDRYFIDDIATQIWACEAAPEGSNSPAPMTFRIVEGGYGDYLAEVRREKDIAAGVGPIQRGGSHKAVVADKKSKSKPVHHEPKLVQVAHKEDQRELRRVARRVEALEEQIADTETNFDRTTASLQDPAIMSDPAKAAELGQQYEDLKASLAALMDEWAEESEKLG